jgi:murein DD-endopeptidase MepM/ murein hydrolase activator NlpD
MWKQAALAAGLAFAGLAMMDARFGARATETPISAPTAGVAPSLADAVSALSIAQRRSSQRNSSLAANAVANDLARYLTVGARKAASRSPPLAPPLSASVTAIGGLIDAGDAQGVIIPYGAQGRDGRLTRGMTVAVSPGGTIYAPFAGTIGYAGPLEGYGAVVILLAPDRSALVITGLAQTTAREGSRAPKGAALGVMPGDSAVLLAEASLTSLATQAPELYLEVRQDGRFIDPAQWLRERN